MLNEANLPTDTLLSVIQTHTTKLEEIESPADRVTPQKLVEQSAKLIRQLALIKLTRVTRVAPHATAICSLIVSAQMNFTRETERSLSETLRYLCQDQETVEVIMG